MKNVEYIFKKPFEQETMIKPDGKKQVFSVLKANLCILICILIYFWVGDG